MLGRHHLALSVLTVAVVVLPVFTIYPTLVLLILVGSAIGSLIPDADSPDAAIFHTEIRGIRGGLGDVLNAVSVLNPAFGYVTKFLIYKPSIRFYDRFVFAEKEITERHRGFLHSFLGVGTTVVLTGLYAVPVLFVLDLLVVVAFGVFLVGYLAGALLHLLEDSCTRSGIEWNFPFQEWRLRGELRTTGQLSDRVYQEGFQAVLLAAAVGMFFAPSVLETVHAFVLSAAGLLLATGFWALFAIGVAGVRLHTS